MIMAGGGGTRFWPRSRAVRPKQFLALAGERTLVQQACDRLEALVPPANTWVITSQAHAAATSKQLPQLPVDNIVGEPCGRDTAACIGLGAAFIARTDPQATMIVTPADHVIEPTAEFARAVRAAAMVVEEHPSALVTFGIVPTFPATGYGYIHRGAALEARQNVPAFRVQSFREKPSFRSGRETHCERRLLLEQRHLHLEGRDDSRRIAQAQAGPGGGRRTHCGRRIPATIEHAQRSTTRRSRRSASISPSWSTRPR